MGSLACPRTAIIRALDDAGGLVQRDQAVRAAYPHAFTNAVLNGRRRRSLAQSGTSRALAALERKGLIVKEREQISGSILIRLACLKQLPVWEELARAEDDFAARCAEAAAAWRTLERRARLRAEHIRRERLLVVSEHERRVDRIRIPSASYSASIPEGWSNPDAKVG